MEKQKQEFTVGHSDNVVPPAEPNISVVLMCGGLNQSVVTNQFLTVVFKLLKDASETMTRSSPMPGRYLKHKYVDLPVQ